MTKLKFARLFCVSLVVSFGLLPAFAAPIRPSQRHEAGGNKTGKYVEEGYFAGGESRVTSAQLTDIRRANSGQGFERIVLDLKAASGDSDAIPYFEVKAAPQEGRVVLSIWSNVNYDFDAAKIHKLFSKSKNIKTLNVLPRVEDGLTVIEFVLSKPKAKFEVFRLARPSRIIMDII